MPNPFDRRAQINLPNRIRSAFESQDNFTPRLKLADRIADLPGVAVTESDSNAGPYTVRVQLTLPVAQDATANVQHLFAEISRDGVVLHGLGRWDKHKVLSSGWGKLRHRGVLVFLPRDERELEICWTIIQRAFDRLAGHSTDRSMRAAHIPDFLQPMRLRL